MCTSMLMDLFSCCFPRKRPRPETRNQPNEQTYLIPTEPQQENPDDEITRRQRALQDRLTGIVRAKEGKMVNLHIRLPFNLHNRTSSSLSERLDPSSSRSASDSLLASPSPTSPRYPISYAVNHHQHHYTSPLGFADERNSSTSRSSSRLAPHTGHHWRPDVGEHDDAEAGDEAGPHPEEETRPILNLRLVNPNSAFGIGTNNKPVLTRGRSPLKYATTLETEPPSISGAQSALPPPPPPPHSPQSDVTESLGMGHEPAEGKDESEGEDMKSPSSTVGPSAATPQTPTDAEQLVVSISPASTTSFKIQETTPLILDWGS